MRRRVGVGAALGLVLVAVVGFFPTPFERGDDLRCTRWIKVRCHDVSGRVLRVDRSDSDGDGDLHLILSSRESVTWPGVSIVKIPANRRPRSIPGFGDWVEVLGYTYRGDHGEQLLGVVKLDRFR